MLIKLDAFRGQHRKLKNRWSGELNTVVNRVADDVPTYVVTGDKTGNRQVLHRAEYDPTSVLARIFRPEGGLLSPRGVNGDAPQLDGL